MVVAFRSIKQQSLRRIFVNLLKLKILILSGIVVLVGANGVLAKTIAAKPAPSPSPSVVPSPSLTPSLSPTPIILSCPSKRSEAAMVVKLSGAALQVLAKESDGLNDEEFAKEMSGAAFFVKVASEAIRDLPEQCFNSYRSKEMTEKLETYASGLGAPISREQFESGANLFLQEILTKYSEELDNNGRVVKRKN